MTGEKSSTSPYPEALSFDYASTSDDTDINQQICFNNTANNKTLQDYLTSHDHWDTGYCHFPSQQEENFNVWTMGELSSVMPQNHDTQDITIHSSNNNIMSIENIDHESNGYLNLEMPPAPFSAYSDPVWDQPSGSGSRLSSKRKSLERNIGQSSNQSQNVRGISSRDVTTESAFSLNLNGNAHRSLGNYRVDSVPVNLPLTRVSPQLLVQNISSQSLAGGLRVASSRRTPNPSRWTEGFVSRRGHSSSSRERIEVPGEAITSITLPGNILEHQPVFTQTIDLRNFVQNSVASNSHGNRPQYPQRLPNFVRQPLLASASSDNGGQSSNSDVLVSGAGSRNHRVLNTRPRLLLDRPHDGATGHSLRGLASGGAGRIRVVSEQIRNVIDLMRRGENLRFEDVVLVDPSMLFGMIDTRDHHRDMRLDIDNMTYEELLALEESIGDVNTGLGEETISNLLKKKKYFSMATSTQLLDEPCCVCQEEYQDGEDVGTLDCGHEFHSACIKQWLMHKNLCPICKTTAFSK